MIAALIAARGGSVRLPRKNIKLFCGHPLIAWSIMQARCSHLIDLVYLTTDDGEIADIAAAYGALPLADPPRIEGQSCPRAMDHGIHLITQEHPDCDTVVSILPTSPLNLPGDFDRGIRLYREYGCDVIRPLAPQRETVILKKLNDYRARGVLFGKAYEYLGQAGGWCVTSPAWYHAYYKHMTSLKDADIDREGKESGGGECYYFPQKCWQTADVDTAEEFELAEVLMEHYILKGHGVAVYEKYAQEKLNRAAGNLKQQ